jgi:hypothetical protein
MIYWVDVRPSGTDRDIVGRRARAYISKAYRTGNVNNKYVQQHDDSQFVQQRAVFKYRSRIAYSNTDRTVSCYVFLLIHRYIFDRSPSMYPQGPFC